MKTTEIQICRLQSIIKRLTFIGKINIGRMLFLLAFMTVTWVRLHIASEGIMDPTEHDLTPAPMSDIHWMMTTNLGLAIASLCLFLIWAPARTICLFKIKKLKKDADA